VYKYAWSSKYQHVRQSRSGSRVTGGDEKQEL
jgi:hypothetical protein